VNDDRRRTGTRSRPDDSRDERPMRRVRQRAPRPELPEGVRPQLPGAVRRELKQHVRGRELADEVGLAIMLAGDAIDADDPEGALPYLEWAKEVAPRAPAIREALGVAQYLRGEYKVALNELRAYRRLSGANDQDHLVADCMRANGHDATEVAAVVQAMVDSDAPADRRLEALLVWAGAVADGGDLAAGRAVLRRADRSLVDAAGPAAMDRLTYVAGDLAERDGDVAAARRAFERLLERAEDPYDAGERLAGLPEG
jgi:hypothetical protein